jgi:predicted nucleotidyltransferase component of viral defense system
MFYDILDSKRKSILPLLAAFKSDFYLAGGTALALQIGHRDSMDFDFFSQEHFDTAALYEYVLDVFSEHSVSKIQEEKDTLTVLIDDDVRISFFQYRYTLVEKCIDEPSLRIASIKDIGCMKLSAIVSRATEKDYIDLYYIMQAISLADLLAATSDKMPDLEHMLILKSMLYFEDIPAENLRWKHNKEITFSKIKKVLSAEVKKILPR